MLEIHSADGSLALSCQRTKSFLSRGFVSFSRVCTMKRCSNQDGPSFLDCSRTLSFPFLGMSCRLTSSAVVIVTRDIMQYYFSCDYLFFSALMKGQNLTKTSKRFEFLILFQLKKMQPQFFSLILYLYFFRIPKYFIRENTKHSKILTCIPSIKVKYFNTLFVFISIYTCFNHIQLN